MMADQGTFTAGQVLTAAELNAFRQITIVRQNGLSVPNTTNTIPAFNIEDIDVGGWHSGTSGNVTPDLDGIFMVVGNARLLEGTTRGIIVLTRNGGPIADIDVSGGRDLSISACASASSGDNFSMFVWQQSGSTQTPDVRFSVELVRAL